MQTIGQIFEKQVHNHPDNIALTFRNQSITYQALNEKSNQYAHYLRETGLKPDACVALCMSRTPAFLISMLGIIKAGGAYLPLDINQPENRLFMILKDNNNPLVITESNFREKLTEYAGTLLFYDEDNPVHQQPVSNPSSVTNPNHLAYIIYTSGSTGKPKGVMIEHESLINFANWFADFSGCQPKDRIDFSSNVSFDMAVSNSIVSLMLGLHLEICDDDTKKNTRWYLQHLASRKINYIKLTPGYFKILIHEAKNSRVSLPHLKGIILGGERLSTSDCASWLSIYPNHLLFNEYGPTETTVAISQFTVTADNVDTLGADVPIGKPGPDMECFFLDKNNNLVEDGNIGQLHVGGKCLARGYLNQPQLTAEKFISTSFCSGLYRTGDLGKRLSDGNIEYHGRIDHQIKIRGFRIEPGEIEYFLLTHPALENAVVLARDTGHDEPWLVAYFIVKNRHENPDSQELKQFLKTYLPSHMIPVAFMKMESFPLNDNGKLDRDAFPLPCIEKRSEYRIPQTLLEKKMADIWSEELQTENIGLDDNFFEAGGHSLSAARIISRIAHEFGKDIAYSDFYNASTLEILCHLVEDADDAKNTIDISNAPIDTKQALPLSYFQFMLWISNTFAPEVKRLNIITRKRLHGSVNKEAIQFAFEALLKKHEILSFCVATFRPVQKIKRNDRFYIEEKDITDLPEWETNAVLDTAFLHLLHKPWKQSPYLKTQLFYLSDNRIEIQIAMPHILSDGVSIDILWNDLSKYYIFYSKESNIDQIKTNTNYRNYIIQEQQQAQETYDADLAFWKQYLKSVSLWTLPVEQVVTGMKAKNIPFSTYIKIPNKNLRKIEDFCAKSHITIGNGITAALTLAIHRCSGNIPQDIVMNMIKSTRDHAMYDDVIGCFLRLEPVRIHLEKNTTISEISSQIQQSVVDTAPYQTCPSLAKLSCIGSFQKKRHTLRSFLMKSLISLYGFFLGFPRMETNTMRMAESLNAKSLKNHFLVNVNVTPITKNKKLTRFFGLKTLPIELKTYDLLSINNLLDISIYPDDNDNISWLVISGNIKPEFRQSIAEAFLDIIIMDHKRILKLGAFSE